MDGAEDIRSLVASSKLALPESWLHDQSEAELHRVLEAHQAFRFGWLSLFSGIFAAMSVPMLAGAVLLRAAQGSSAWEQAAWCAFAAFALAAALGWRIARRGDALAEQILDELETRRRQ